ncbi:NAD(P)-binding protein [Thozetella sp. PMI_491]|nr:NAD(P)-binding protein [Thozetella sp. PMI_491]
MTTRHILLLGGHGQVAQHLTAFLLQASLSVTSIVRNPDQVSALEKLGENRSGTLEVLVRSLEDVKSEAQAKAILDEVKPDCVVWSAGAGGKGGPERTLAIDRDAAVHFIHASAAYGSITRFLMVSYLASRLQRPAWWDDASWKSACELNTKILPTYYQAKIAADEALYRVSKQRPEFVGINLRPGTLTTENAGKVELGKTKGSRGNVSRESVAKIAALLLQSEGIENTWLDLLDGDEEPEAAVERVIRDHVNAAEGEPFF